MFDVLRFSLSWSEFHTYFIINLFIYYVIQCSLDVWSSRENFCDDEFPISWKEQWWPGRSQGRHYSKLKKSEAQCGVIIFTLIGGDQTSFKVKTNEDNEIISPPAGLMTQLMMATLGQKYSPSWEAYFTQRQDILSIFKQSRSLAPCKFLSNLKTKQRITSTII